MMISLVPFCCSIAAFLFFLDLHSIFAVAASDPDIGEATGNPDYISLFRNLPEDFNKHELGCADPSGPVDVYSWRRSGYGSNINNMMLPWLNALQLGRRDLALITKTFSWIKCTTESNGVETTGGYSCLFAEMPHICIFRTQQVWENFMIERNLSIAAREDALSRNGVTNDEAMIPGIKHHLKESNVDLISIMAVLLDYIHSHWQPWLKRDIQSILDEPETTTVREVPYISMHVRRGDKIIREAKPHDVKEYLEAARSYITNSTDSTVSIEDIRGIWVASDDERIISDVKQHIADFFPNVELERVVWISKHSLTNNFDASKNYVPTKTNTMHYGSYVVFFAELTALAEGRVFVGTFSSNVGRMVVLLREAKGLPRSSTISVDTPTWYPGRRALLTE